MKFKPKISLKRKFIISYLLVAFLSTVFLIFSLIFFFILKYYNDELNNQNIPILQAVGNLETGTQESLAALRGWIAIKDKKFLTERQHAWNVSIVPELNILKNQSTNLKKQKLSSQQKKLYELLSDLNGWQWYIEDVAHTPGNFPIKTFFNQRLLPVANHIIGYSNAFLHQETYFQNDKFTQNIVYLLNQFKSNFIHSMNKFFEYIISNDNADLNNSQILLKIASGYLEKLSAISKQFDVTQKPLFARMQNDFSLYKELKDELIDINQNHSENTAVTILEEHAIPLARQIKNLLTTMTTYNENQVKKSIKTVRALSIVIPLFVVIFIFLVIILSIWQAISNANDFLRPIYLLRYAAKKLANKRLDEEIPVTTNDELAELTVAFNELISQRKVAEKKVYNLAHYDSLTGLPNRVSLAQFFEKIRKNLHKNKKLAFLYLSIDNFKSINELLGEKMGDTLITKIAEALRQLSSHKAHLFQIRRVKFLFLVEFSDEIVSFAERMMKVICKEHQIEDEELNISASIGVAVYPDIAKSFNDLMNAVEVALSDARIKGIGNIEYFSKESSKTYFRMLEIETALNKAVENDELYLLYQPRININNQKIAGVEALARWKNSQFGDVSPAEFIPIAERAGYLNKMGKDLIEKAFEQLSQWQKQHGEIDFRMAINISPYQLLAAHFIEEIKSFLKKYNIIPKFLEFEITESVFQGESHQIEEVLQELKMLGISLAIDDFGTHYSSLSRLKTLPIDLLKIDQSFVKGVANNHHDAGIVKAVLTLAKALSLDVVAEGVETEEQLKILVEYQCDQAQGFYFSKPVTADKIDEYIKQMN